VAARKEGVAALRLADEVQRELAPDAVPDRGFLDRAVGDERGEERIAGRRRLARRREERAPLGGGARVAARQAVPKRVAGDLGVVREEPRVLRPERGPVAARGQGLEPFPAQRFGERAVPVALEEGADLGGIGALDGARKEPVRRIGLEGMARIARGPSLEGLRLPALRGLPRREQLLLGGRGPGPRPRRPRGRGAGERHGQDEVDEERPRWHRGAAGKRPDYRPPRAPGRE